MLRRLPYQRGFVVDEGADIVEKTSLLKQGNVHGYLVVGYITKTRVLRSKNAVWMRMVPRERC